ncbi:MAG: hypothetical protein JNM07_01200 [Phycisphaerae bacterium]|nr:hypothetical protein [Phycisphaerae bacterium]
MRSFVPAAVWVLLCATASLAQQAPGFEALGSLGGGSTVASSVQGISRDGRVIVGSALNTAQGRYEPVRWTAGAGFASLGFLTGHASGTAYDVNEDGSVIVGSLTRTTGGYTAFRWTASDGLKALTGLPSNVTGSIPYAVNRDGTVLAGVAYGTLSTSQGTRSASQVFLWTAAQGMVVLGELPNACAGETDRSYGMDLSDDGSVLVGYSRSGTCRLEAFRWTLAGGFTTLGGLGGPSMNSAAEGISGDGSVVVGWGVTTGGSRASRWVDGQIQDLGALPNPTGRASAATACNADGRVVVGTSRVGAANTGFAWYHRYGMYDLQARLTALGVHAVAGWALTNITGVSGDGSVIVGWGRDPQGRSSGFRITLPACPNDANYDGSLDDTDYFEFLNAFFANDPAADINHDNVVDGADFEDFVAGFVAGC